MFIVARRSGLWCVYTSMIVDEARAGRARASGAWWKLPTFQPRSSSSWCRFDEHRFLISTDVATLSLIKLTGSCTRSSTIWNESDWWPLVLIVGPRDNNNDGLVSHSSSNGRGRRRRRRRRKVSAHSLRTEPASCEVQDTFSPPSPQLAFPICKIYSSAVLYSGKKGKDKEKYKMESKKAYGLWWTPLFLRKKKRERKKTGEKNTAWGWLLINHPQRFLAFFFLSFFLSSSRSIRQKKKKTNDCTKFCSKNFCFLCGRHRTKSLTKRGSGFLRDTWLCVLFHTGT